MIMMDWPWVVTVEIIRSGWILKVKTIGFPHGLDLSCEESRVLKMTSKILV